jgi:hypothetical protein
LLRVIDVELAVGAELRVKGKRQQPFFILNERLARADVEEDFFLAAVSIRRQQPDSSGLFHQNHALRAVGQFFHPHRAVKGQRREG